MELIRGLNNLKDHHHGCVLTIGKFDGVHLGHQAVLANVIEQARRLSLPATVMVFEPHPEEVFTPETAPARSDLTDAGPWRPSSWAPRTPRHSTGRSGTSRAQCGPPGRSPCWGSSSNSHVHCTVRQWLSGNMQAQRPFCCWVARYRPGSPRSRRCLGQT